MLHRTQTKQVIPIYERFIKDYPTLVDYAKADRFEVTEILKSLGLSWRIQGMLKPVMARAITKMKITARTAYPPSDS